MASGFNHLHKRKRIYKNFEEYPSPNKFKRFFDYFIYIIAILSPFISVPQVYAIWYFRNISGVSLLTWSGILFGGIFWLIYGFIHKEKPIIITNTLGIIFSLLIVYGILKFG